MHVTVIISMKGGRAHLIHSLTIAKPSLTPDTNTLSPYSHGMVRIKQRLFAAIFYYLVAIVHTQYPGGLYSLTTCLAGP